MKRILLLVIISFSINAFSQTTAEENSLHLDWLDLKTKPAEDFYQYANGGWLKQNPIPQDEAKWAHFKIMEKTIDDRLKKILQNLNKNSSQYGSGDIEKKLADFYASGMNQQMIESQGFHPIDSLLNDINQLQSNKNLGMLFAKLHLAGINAPFSISSMQDFYNTDEVIPYVMQSGLGMPDRDYYTDQSPRFIKIREAYKNYIIKLMTLIKHPEPQNAAENILLIEQKLAEASLRQAEQRDPYTIYHRMPILRFEALYKNINWNEYFNTINLPKTDSINLAMPKFFDKFNAMLKDISIDKWRDYLQFHVANEYAIYLSKPFHNEAFDFQRLFTGTVKEKPYEEQVVKTVNANMGFALGKIYVSQYFSKKDKQKAIEIVENIESAFASIIKNQIWMLPKTQQAALAKLIHMQKQVGYPNSWPDYSNLQINPNEYAANIMHANAWQLNHELQKIGKPVDLDEWSMPPQTVNAYYDPSKNSLSILAGILQPPFFDPNGSIASNYGGIGFVIAHEITHGFDDQGSKFDSHGNLNNWWQIKDEKAFKKATKCIADQFSKYTVNNNTHIQGDLVVGEATADLGGAATALLALQQTKEFNAIPTIKNFTPIQQFFLSMAHIWGQNIRPELEHTYATLDPHPPAKYRVNGTIKNMLSFYQSYGLAITSPPCSVWTDDTIIVLNKNKINFKVTLPGNPTTGYQWELINYDQAQFENPTREYKPFNTGMMGSGGYFVFKLELKRNAKKSNTSLQFKYARPWEVTANNQAQGTIKNVYVFYK